LPAAGAGPPSAPVGLTLRAGAEAPADVGPPLVLGEWSAACVSAPLDEAAAREALGATAVDLLVAALGSVLPGPYQVVEVSDVDRLLAGGQPSRPAGRHARDVRLLVPAGGPTGDWVGAVREVKEALRAAAAGAGTADSPALCVSVLPALPDGVRDVDDGQGALVAPLDVRVRLAAGSAEMVLRGLSAPWPPPLLRDLVGRAAAALRAIGDAVGGLRSRVYTPSDFPAAELSQDQLDRLLDQLSGGR
jgi:hypothetical protein